MSDVTLADIQKKIPDARLIELTDDAGAGTIDVDTVNQAIADAYAEMWPYVGVKYSVPITPTPDALKPSIVATAIKNLFSRVVAEMEPSRQDDYNGAVSFWKDISRGLATLGIDPPPSAPTSGSPETNVSASPRIFTRDKMKGF